MPMTMLPRAEVVLFDLDGTLVDSIDLIVRTWQATVWEHLGLVHSREEVVPRIGRSLESLFDELDSSRTAEMAAWYRARMAQWHDDWIRGYVGVDALLEGLSSAGARLGLVTSKSASSAGPSMERFQLGRWMEVVVTSDWTTRHKPDPEPLVAAATHLDVSPSACWYVGDSVHDLMAARAAGMLGVGVSWGATPGDILAPLADHMVSTPAEVLTLWRGSESG